MYEISIALKYLIPRKKQLSVALIAVLSLVVISSVVWLVLIFLSVTEGIEKNWLKKLTSLNAPVRITPTPTFFSSYYYQIDSMSSSSGYSPKSIGEKALTLLSDPYNQEEDRELPPYFPNPELNEEDSLIDPVKIAFKVLETYQKTREDFVFQDYEMTGAILKLQQLRSTAPFSSNGRESLNFLTQASYLASFADRSPYVHSLLIPPTAKDINHLLFLSLRSFEGSIQDNPELHSLSGEQISPAFINLLQKIKITKLRTLSPFWKIPSSFLQGKELQAIAYLKNNKISHVIIPIDWDQFVKTLKKKDDILLGKIRNEEKSFVFFTSEKKLSIPFTASISLDSPLIFKVIGDPVFSSNPLLLKDLTFKVQTKLQGVSIEEEIPFENIEIADFSQKSPFEASTLWCSVNFPQSQKTHVVLPVNERKEKGILLPKSFQENGVLLGDRGFLSYSSSTTTSTQEQRIPIFVAGFYDPGILSVGNKCILVPQSITRAIQSSPSAFVFDKISSNGIQVWFNDLKEAEQIKKDLENTFAELGIDKYWKISTFKEYEFAKDLILQFQSDKYLFSLVGIIILIVACSNIISLLVLLVNDKKKEIGMLQSMGASPKSIALIFGTCGIALGIVSCLIGIISAILTLSNIEHIVHFLSFLQGHDAFNSAFYGKTLPNELSVNALIFILVMTPLLSLCAGLIPAIKACRVRPSEILRSD